MAPSRCGHTASYYYFGKDPTFGFGTAVPFGPNQRINQAWWMQGGGTDVLNEFYKKYNVIALLAGNTGCQMGGWFRKEIKTVDDLKGLKMRIGGFAGKVMQKLGVVPQQIAGGDIYPALEKGTIDACEWVGPYDDEKLGFYKVAPYYYYPGWWEGGSMLLAFVNLDEVERAAEVISGVLEQAAGYANLGCMAKYDANNAQALRRLLAGGTKLNVFSPANHGRLPTRRPRRSTWRGGEDQRGLQEGQRLDDGLHEERLSVVPGGARTPTTIHDPRDARLIESSTKRKPRSAAPGFFYCGALL